MPDPLSDENKSAATASFNVAYLKEGSHIVYLPIPDNLLRLIGLVAAHWGVFEVELNKLTDAILRALGREEPGWQRRGFSRRKELFVDLVKGNLESTYPAAAASYRKLAGDAADLYWRRNVVVHGLYRVTFPPAGPDAPQFWAEGVHNKREVRVPIDEPTLQQLWHGIAHLSGGLRATANLHGTADGWPWTLADTEILRIYRETPHPWNPDPNKRPPQS